MKAISLWQPWASLIATGAKRYETRSWATKYRGPLLICAAKGGLSQQELNEFLGLWEFRVGLAPLKGLKGEITINNVPRIWSEDLPFGKAVAIAELVDCIRTEKMTREQMGNDMPFGDFSPGRFAWKLENVKAFEEPFPIRGAQGLFEVDDSIITKMEAGR